MLLFKSILETDKATTQPGDKRTVKRYPVGYDFPFKTQLTLFQNDGVRIANPKGKDWSVTPVNLSATGASVQLSLAAMAYQKEPCRLKFSLGDYFLEVPGTIAHFLCRSQHSQCGIVFNFPNAEVEEAYLQLLEPIIIGNSLVPIAAVQDAPGRHKEQFAGNIATSLTVWHDAPEGAITGFEFRMHQYVVRWSAGSHELEVHGLGPVDSSNPANVAASHIALSETQHEEVRWLFCLAVPNLSTAVPLSIRRFLATLVA
jgi:hypothetical protein